MRRCPMSRWQSELQAVEKQIQELEREGMYVPRSLQERHKLIWQFIKTQEEKMIKVRFPKEQVDLLDSMGTIVYTASGETYRHLPHWFRETDVEGVFELFTFENLPDELIDTIKDMKK